jgi:hypothetical protein
MDGSPELELKSDPTAILVRQLLSNRSRIDPLATDFKGQFKSICG